MWSIEHLRENDVSIEVLSKEIAARQHEISLCEKIPIWKIRAESIRVIKDEIEEINEMINVKIGKC